MGAARHRRSPKTPDVTPLLARLVSQCSSVSVEERAGGLAFRLAGSTEKSDYTITCLLGDLRSAALLTTAEQAVAAQLCDDLEEAGVELRFDAPGGVRVRAVLLDTDGDEIREVALTDVVELALDPSRP